MCSARLLLLPLALWAGAALADEAGGDAALGDPTRPTSLSEPATVRVSAPQGPRWRLQSTLVADDRRLAVINGRTVAPGARVDGATVVDITADTVTLEVGGQRLGLHVVPAAVSVKQSGG